MNRAAHFLIEHFPVVKETALEALELIFAPKTVGRQLALAIALQTGAVSQQKVLCEDPSYRRLHLTPLSLFVCVMAVRFSYLVSFYCR